MVGTCRKCGKSFQINTMVRRATMCGDCRRDKGGKTCKPKTAPQKASQRVELRIGKNAVKTLNSSAGRHIKGMHKPMFNVERYEFVSCDRCAHGPYTTTCAKKQLPGRTMCAWFMERA